MIEALTIATAVGCGLVAGLFAAFSVAVMPALRRRPPAEGIAVMQAVNVAIVNPLFLLVYVGTAALCVAVAVTSGGDALRLAGAALYVVGAFGVTAAANIPLNNALAAADPADTGIWQRYLSRWTAWNHVRTLCAIAAAVALTIT